MIAILVAFPVLAAAAQAPQHVDSIRALARDGPDSVLIERVRQWNDDARRVLSQLRGAAGRGGDSAERALIAAERLAGAYAGAWQDSFFVRQIARFRSLSPADRQATLAADSIYLAGKAALRTGADAALQAWRESHRRYEALADTAGIASVLTAMGAGFHSAQESDSAEGYLALAEGYAERIGDARMLGNALSILGILSWQRGDLQRARDFYTRAKPFRERSGDVVGFAVDQTNLGAVTFSLGDFAGARRAWEVALPAAQTLGEAEGAALILSNLAGLAQREGDYAEAGARESEALQIYRERGNRVYEAQVLVDLGRLAMMRGDFPAAVTRLSEAAGIMRRIGSGPSINAIDNYVELAQARAHMGDVQGARTELQRAEALAARRDRPKSGASLAALAHARADLAVKFNQLAEAERQYGRARRLAQGSGLQEKEQRFRAELGMAGVLLKRESYQRAQVVLEQLLLRPSDSHDRAEIRLGIGLAAWRRGDTATARQAFAAAIDTLRSLGAANDEAEALAKLGDLEANAGRALAAESLFRRAIAGLGTRPASNAWQLHAGLAGALRRRGALAEAARELESGIAEIERVSGGLPLEEQRAAFRADKWDVYVELALVERARGRTEAALEVSERLRARQMLELLARGRPATPGAAGGALASREQDLRRKIAELTRQVEGPGDTGGRGLREPTAVETANAAAGDALARAQEEYTGLLLEMREANPAYAALIRAEIAPASAVMAALAPDEALLEYLVGDSTSVVFVVTADTVEALDLMVNHSTLAALVDFARGTLASPTEGAAQPAWRPPLRRLYQRLVAPVEASGLLAGKRRLLIVPHAELHYLPFAALVRRGTPEQFLVDRYVLEYVPSASVWLRLRDRPVPARGGGVLALAPRPAALPGSREEVAVIQRTYGSRATTLVGRLATESTFRALAPEREIVHLATHGVLNKHNPLFSFVQLGAGGGEDGRLEVHEVFGLTLNARLLVLSACQTGVGAGAVADVPPGDDWVGLVQGFLYAGAGNVLAAVAGFGRRDGAAHGAVLWGACRRPLGGRGARSGAAGGRSESRNGTPVFLGRIHAGPRPVSSTPTPR
jgi:CHAT domain-containing protein